MMLPRRPSRPLALPLAALLTLLTPALLTSVPAARAASPATPAAPAAPAAPVAPAAAKPPADPVVARVDGHPIYRSDVAAAARNLPPQIRGLPVKLLFPLLLNQVIEQKAIALAAAKEGLQNQPAVKREIAQARDRVLENALLTERVAPKITPAAIQAAYQKHYANKPGPAEVHALHILVPTKAEAEKIIAKLEKGADFATLAKKYSKDSSGAKGGDLGFFTAKDMVPAFSKAAFALKTGEYTKTPVHTQFGWHVIKVIARRQGPPAKLAAVAGKIRQDLIRAEVQKVIKQTMAAVKVVRFNLDGSPIQPKPAAPAVPAKPAAPVPAPAPAPAKPAAPAGQ